MSVGFRKSLFGFNSSDVLEYIEKAQRSFNSKETALNKKLDDLKEELERSNQISEALAKEKQELQFQLDEFNAKYEEIERISENIGKLCITAENILNHHIDMRTQFRKFKYISYIYYLIQISFCNGGKLTIDFMNFIHNMHLHIFVK